MQVSTLILKMWLLSKLQQWSEVFLFPRDGKQAGTLPNTTCSGEGVAFLGRAAAIFCVLVSEPLRSQRSELKPQGLCHSLTFPEETRVSAQQKERREKLVTLSELSCQDIFRVLCDHDGCLYFQRSQLRKIYLAAADVFFGRREAGPSRVERFMKCSRGGQHVVPAAWPTGVSSSGTCCSQQSHSARVCCGC